MNKDYVKYELPQVQPVPMAQIFPSYTAPEALNLISQLFQYDPKKRIPPLHACAHTYFDELREPNKKWTNGRELPPLFDFTEFELTHADPPLRSRLAPRTATPTVIGSVAIKIPVIKPNPYSPD